MSKGSLITNDGLMNVVANLGTDRDKAFHSVYAMPTLTDDQAHNAYRGSALAKKIINIPADDACSEWREWQAQADEISKIEAEETRLGVQNKIRQALTWARLLGGAVVFIGDGGKDPSKELLPEKIGKGGLKYLTVLTKNQISIGEINQNMTSDGFGKPISYRLSGISLCDVPVHPSRLVVLHGQEVPPDQFMDGWSDGVLLSVIDGLKRLDNTSSNIASLVFEAKVDVLKIPDFTENLTNGGKEYEAAVIARASLAQRAKGINGTLLLDKEEEWIQKSASFATLPDILVGFMQLVSGDADIPVTRLFGKAASGLNATGEGDEKNYNKSIRTLQSLRIQPAMSVLDQCIIYSALGHRPDEIHYNWRPLGVPTLKERAETADKLMAAIDKLHKMDVTPPEALADAAVNALTELGAFAGLEASVAEYVEGKEEE